MTYSEALQKALTVKWKITLCHTGEECWCRMIEPEEKIEDDDGNEVYIAPAACLSAIHAEHIVKLHNEYIDKLNS